MSENNNVSPAVLEAKKRKTKDEDVMELDSGVLVRVKQVPPGLLQDVVGNIKPPKVPVFFNEDKGRDEPNPNHPDYIEAMKQYENDQGAATLDAIALFGIELVDGLPKDDSWVRKLKIMARRNGLDLSDYDLEDEIDLHFLYVRYIALAGTDYVNLGKAMTGIAPEEVEVAQDMFPADAGWTSDRGGAS